MAITGTFQADFAAFYDAVTKAEVHLKSFETGSAKVERQLDQMVNSLSGTRIVQQATIAAEAVDRIGGVSKLTDSELARVSATAQEAAAKLRAMGQDVPPGIQNIADAAKNADTAHHTLGSTVRGLITDFAAMFTARAAFNFVKSTIDEASALKDLSNETHISVEELQTLGGAMSEFGVDSEEMGRALYRLQRGIASGDESVVHALHVMGMSLKDVDALQGKELFLRIMDGLSTLQGGLRDSTSAELFGGKLGAAMGGASKDIRAAVAEWERLNHVASTESVDAMDRFGESIARANKNIDAMSANLIGPLAEGFNVLFDKVNSGTPKWSIFWAMVRDAINASHGLGTGTEHLTSLLAEQDIQAFKTGETAKRLGDIHLEVAKAVEKRTREEKFMDALEADAAVQLTAAQIKNLEHLKEIGALNAKNAEGIGVNIQQFQKYTESLKLAEAAAAEHKAYMKALADAMEELNSVGQGWRGTLETIDGETVEAIKYYLDAGVSLDKLALAYELTAAQVKAVASLRKEEIAGLRDEQAAVEQTSKLWDEYYANVIRNSGTATDAQIADVQRWAEDLMAQAQRSGTDTAEFYQALTALWNQKLDVIAGKTGGLITDLSTNTKRGLQQIADKAQAVYEDAAAHVGTFSAETIEHYRVIAAKAQEAADRFGTSFVAADDAVIAANENMLSSLTTSALTSFAVIGRGVDDLAARMQDQASQFRDLYIEYGEQGWFGWSPWDPWTPPPGRAAGGPVSAGAPYMVGERGPELFIPRTSGTIAPNGAGTVVNNYFYVNGTAADVARQVMTEITKTMKQSRQWPSA